MNSDQVTDPATEPVSRRAGSAGPTSIPPPDLERMVEGHGVAADPAYFEESGRPLHDIGYARLAEQLAR
jgi:hypothetical protein